MVPSVQPFAVGTRSTVTPGVRRSMRNIDRPRDPRDDGSVRAIVPHQSLLCAPVTSTFSPSRTKPPPPSASAVVVMFARSDPAPASVYAMHAVQEPDVAAGRNCSRCASDPKASTVGATSTAAVSIIGASWYAASKLTTACQLRGLPPPPYSGGRLTPRRPAAPARVSSPRSNALVPAGEIAAIAVVGNVRRGHLRAQEPADLLAEGCEVVGEQEIGKHEVGRRVGSLRT